MKTATKNRTAMVRVLAFGLMLATLLVMLHSTASADAAVTMGKAYSWGYNYNGQLGNVTNGDGTEIDVPGAVSNLQGVKSIKAGCDHGLALKNDGTVRAWGYNYYGQLGNGNTGTDTNVPVKVQIDDVKAVSAGCDHSLALKENGTVWAWGRNTYGQLGNGADGAGTDSNVPVRVAGIGTGARAIAAGEHFSLALMNDGTVRSWGYNSDGQLGNGTETSRNTPGPVGKLSNVKAIATDSSAGHALALSGDGTVKSWGYNSYGQLGNGSPIPGAHKTTPVRVANLSGVRAVATGGFHSLALTESGRVKAWGGNNQGELGNGDHGDSADSSTPVNVVGLTGVRSISGGRNHSLAILENGQPRSWGANPYGELGNDTSGPAAASDVPVAVKNLTNVKAIDGGYSFTLAATQ